MFENNSSALITFDSSAYIENDSWPSLFSHDKSSVDLIALLRILYYLNVICMKMFQEDNLQQKSRDDFD